MHYSRPSNDLRMPSYTRTIESAQSTCATQMKIKHSPLLFSHLQNVIGQSKKRTHVGTTNFQMPVWDPLPIAECCDSTSTRPRQLILCSHRQDCWSGLISSRCLQCF